MHTTSTVEFPPLKDFSSIVAENNPNREAFADGTDGDQVTWSEFDSDSNRAANALRKYVGQGDRVAFVCEASVDHITLWNGALKSGCVEPPHSVVAEDDAKLHRPAPAVHAGAQRSILGFLRGASLRRDNDGSRRSSHDWRGADEYEIPIDDVLADHDAEEPDVRAREDDVAAILWTSGTTGQPKG